MRGFRAGSASERTRGDAAGQPVDADFVGLPVGGELDGCAAGAAVRIEADAGSFGRCAFSFGRCYQDIDRWIEPQDRASIIKKKCPLARVDPRDALFATA